MESREFRPEVNRQALEEMLFELVGEELTRKFIEIVDKPELQHEIRIVSDMADRISKGKAKMSKQELEAFLRNLVEIYG